MDIETSETDTLALMENLLKAPKVPPATKVLLLILALDGKARTAPELAADTGLTVTQCHYWLRTAVESGAVARGRTPNYKTEVFETTYKVPPVQDTVPESA